MSFPYTLHLQDEKLESLHTQRDYLNILRLRHLQWMNSADDPQTGVVHQEIAQLIEQVTAQYNHLLDALQPRDIGSDPKSSY